MNIIIIICDISRSTDQVDATLPHATIQEQGGVNGGPSSYSVKEMRNEIENDARTQSGLSGRELGAGDVFDIEAG